MHYLHVIKTYYQFLQHAARLDCIDQQTKSPISLFASTCTYDIQQIKIIFTYPHHTFPSKIQNKTDKIDPDMLS